MTAIDQVYISTRLSELSELATRKLAVYGKPGVFYHLHMDSRGASIARYSWEETDAKKPDYFICKDSPYEIAVASIDNEATEIKTFWHHENTSDT